MPASTVLRSAHGRRAGPALLLAAAVLVLALEDLRARLTVPDPAWVALLVGLLAVGGVATARGLRWTAPPARRRRGARLAIVAGALGFGVGGVGASGAGAGRTEDVRGAAALAFVVSFAVLPAGLVLARRAGRDLRDLQARQPAAGAPPARQGGGG